GWDVPGPFAAAGRLDADDRARLGAGVPLDVQPGGGRAGADAHGLAVPPPGQLAVAPGPWRGAWGGLVPGRLALAPLPARGDAAGQRGREGPDRRGEGRADSCLAPRRPVGRDAPLVERLGPVVDVRLHRLQRQLLPVPVRLLPAGLPPPRQG